MKLDVQGMTCGHCVKAVTAAIAALDPHARVQVDLATGRVDIDGPTEAPRVIAALLAEGYPAALVVDTSSAPDADSDTGPGTPAARG